MLVLDLNLSAISFVQDFEKQKFKDFSRIKIKLFKAKSEMVLGTFRAHA